VSHGPSEIGLNIEPSLVQGRMLEGKITVLSERGVDEDAGRYRLALTNAAFEGKADIVRA